MCAAAPTPDPSSGSSPDSPKPAEHVSRNSFRNIAANAATFLRTHLQLAVIVGILAIAGYVTQDLIGALEAKNATLETDLKTEKAAHDAEVGSLRQEISELLPSSVNFPIPFDPPNEAALVGPAVTLQWNEKAPHQSYLVEVRRLNGIDPSVFTNVQTFPATDPRKLRTRFPLRADQVIAPGTYMWRVVPGSKTESHEEYEGSWSGYYTFTIYPSVLDRIKLTKTLRVGVSYVQNSAFMSLDEQGKAVGFDATLMHAVAQQLTNDGDVSTDINVEYHDYPTIDQILFHGIKQGEVDLAIGSITKAKYRERRGIIFSDGYLESRLVLLAPATPSKSLSLTPDTKVGVVKETANFEALRYLQRKYHFQAIPVDSYQELLADLQSNAVDYMLIDKPLVLNLIARGDVVIAKDVTTDLHSYLQEQVGYPREEYAIATGDPILCRKINGILRSQPFTKMMASLKGNYGVK